MIFPTLPGGWIRLVLWRHLLSVKSPDSFVAQVGRCEMNEAGESREKEDCLVSEVGGCHSAELDFIPASGQKDHMRNGKSFKPGLLFSTVKKKIDLPIAQIWIPVPSWTSLLQPSFFWTSCFVLALESILVSWVPSIPCQYLGLYPQGLWHFQSSGQDRCFSERWEYRLYTPTNGGPSSSPVSWSFPQVLPSKEDEFLFIFKRLELMSSSQQFLCSVPWG